VIEDLRKMVNRWLGPDDWMGSWIRISIHPQSVEIECRRDDELVEAVPEEITAHLDEIRRLLPLGVFPIQLRFTGWPEFNPDEGQEVLAGVLHGAWVAGIELEDPEPEACDRAIIAMKGICGEFAPGELKPSRNAPRRSFMILETFEGGSTRSKATTKAVSPKAALAKYVAATTGASRLEGEGGVRDLIRSGRAGALSVTEAPTAAAEIFDVDPPAPRWLSSEEIEF
jgi:hypothetical protein